MWTFNSLKARGLAKLNGRVSNLGWKGPLEVMEIGVAHNLVFLAAQQVSGEIPMVLVSPGSWVGRSSHQLSTAASSHCKPLGSALSSRYICPYRMFSRLWQT